MPESMGKLNQTFLSFSPLRYSRVPEQQMAIATWSTIRLRIRHALVHVWNCLFAAYFGVVHAKQSESSIPLPATSSNHTSFFPIAIKYSRHTTEFEASQQRLRQSIRLQNASLRDPQRCTTPLLPFHHIPSSVDEEEIGERSTNSDNSNGSSDDGASVTSSPSLSLHTPLATSDAVRSADPLVYHTGSRYSSFNFSHFYDPGYTQNFCDMEELTLSDYELCALTKSSYVFRNSIARDYPLRVNNRRFCGCKMRCSSYTPITPPPITGPLSVHDSPALNHGFSSIPRTSFTGALLQVWRGTTPADDILLDSLGFTIPDPSSGSLRQELLLADKPPETRPGHNNSAKTVITRAATFVHSSGPIKVLPSSSPVYSRALVRNTVPGKSLNGVISDAHTPFSVYSGAWAIYHEPKIDIRSVLCREQLPLISGVVARTRPFRPTSIDSSPGTAQQLSALGMGCSSVGLAPSEMDQLRSLRELVATFDQTIMTSCRAMHSPFGAEQTDWLDLDWEDVDPGWSSDSGFASQGIAL